MIEVSIIVPVYNACLYIEDCLNSVKNQTMQNWECIVIDDGSTDNTYELIINLVGDDKRFKIYKQKNRGVSVARNMGIDKSQGKYVIFLDSDDLLQEDYIEVMYEITNKNQYDILFSDHQIITTDNNVITSMEHKRRLSINSESFSWKELLETAWLDCCWAKLFKKTANRNYRFPVGINLGEDTMFVLSIINQHIKVGLSMCNGYVHRMTGTGLSKKYDCNRPYYMMRYYKTLFKFSDKMRGVMSYLIMQ